MALHLTGGTLAKPRKLNPYKRITRGVEKNIVVDEQEVVAITDNVGKYTYLNVAGVDYYVSDPLEEGGAYETADIVAAPKPPKAEPVVDPETGEVVKPKRKRGKKAQEEVAESEVEAA